MNIFKPSKEVLSMKKRKDILGLQINAPHTHTMFPSLGWSNRTGGRGLTLRFTAKVVSLWSNSDLSSISYRSYLGPFLMSLSSFKHSMCCLTCQYKRSILLFSWGVCCMILSRNWLLYSSISSSSFLIAMKNPFSATCSQYSYYRSIILIFFFLMA